MLQMATDRACTASRILVFLASSVRTLAAAAITWWRLTCAVTVTVISRKISTPTIRSEVTNDIIGLIKALGYATAIVVGHD